MTVQELTNFLVAIKSIIDPEKLKRDLGAGHITALEIDRLMNALDRGLELMIRQMDMGLFNLDDPLQSAKGVAGDIVPPRGFTGVAAHGLPHAPQPLDTSHDIAAAQIAAEHRRRQTAAVQATAGTIGPPKSTDVTADSSEVTADSTTPIGEFTLDATATLRADAAVVPGAETLHREMLARITVLEEMIGALSPPPGGIGHNNPPGTDRRHIIRRSRWSVHRELMRSC